MNEYKKFEERPKGFYYYGKEDVLGEGHFFGPFDTEEEKDHFANAQAGRLQAEVASALANAQADGWLIDKKIEQSAFGADGYVLEKDGNVLILDALGQRNYEAGHVNWFVNQ